MWTLRGSIDDTESGCADAPRESTQPDILRRKSAVSPGGQKGFRRRSRKLLLFNATFCVRRWFAR